ncbi:MAG TPA: hypothetical protein VI160_02400 [Gemmatimonadales bacterium]
MKTAARLTAFALLLASAAPLAAQRRARRLGDPTPGPSVGAHLGYSFDVDEPLLGAQATIPFTPHLGFYPSFDYYFVSNASLWALNLDLKFRPPSRYGAFYFGGGVDLMHASANGVGGSTTNLNLLAGLEGHRRRGNPYLEARLILGDGSAFQMALGFSWR